VTVDRHYAWALAMSVLESRQATCREVDLAYVLRDLREEEPDAPPARREPCDCEYGDCVRCEA